MTVTFCGDSSRRAAPRSAERLREIRNEILSMLDPDRQANEAVADAQGPATVGGNRRVGHERGVLGQGFHAAERLGACEQAQVAK